MNATEQAIALRAEAAFHKREERRHRREKRDAMQRLRALCDAHGIPFEVTASGGRDDE